MTQVTDPQTIVVDPAKLEQFTANLLRGFDFDAADAEIGAKVLVRADLRGHHTHGMRYLPIYVPLIRGGAIRSKAHPWIVRETSSTAVMDGDAGMGQIVAYRATEYAIEMIRRGVGTVTVLVRNSNHFGAADYFPLMCAEAGLIGIVLTNSVPCMSAPGARRAVIGNSPFAFGVPGPDGRNLVLDIALSVTAGSRVVMAHERGERIPEGWLTDPEGRPTTDPGEYHKGGALVPVGAHKGWGLALLVETLSGVLSGAGILSQVLLLPAFPEHPSQTGHTMIVIDPEAFMSREEFNKRLLRMLDEIHTAPTADPDGRIFVPGEIECEHEAESLANGLELDAFTWSILVEMARELGDRDVLESARR